MRRQLTVIEANLLASLEVRNTALRPLLVQAAAAQQYAIVEIGLSVLATCEQMIKALWADDDKTLRRVSPNS